MRLSLTTMMFLIEYDKKARQAIKKWANASAFNARYTHAGCIWQSSKNKFHIAQLAD